MIPILNGKILTITFDDNEAVAVDYVMKKHGVQWFSDLLALELRRRTAQQEYEQKELIWNRLKQKPDLLNQILKD